MRTGYIVDYSKSKGVFDLGFEPRETILCSDGKLIELLQHKLNGTVWSARWLDIEEYLRNHPDTEIKVYE